MGKRNWPETRTIQATKSVIRGLELAKRMKVTPLEVLLGIGSRDPKFADYTDRELNCMIAAAPYVHPRLAAVAYIPPNDGRAEQRRDMLRNLGYHQRQAILDILATAQVQQLEGAAEAAEESEPDGKG